MDKKRIECQKQDLSLPSTPSGAAVGEITRGDDVRMRERDADLLESMHYAASQVSQYSPDGTPILRPKDRSLRMEDVPVMTLPMASTTEILMHHGEINGSNVKYDDVLSSNRYFDSNGSLIQEGGMISGSRQLTSSSCLLQQHQEQSSYRRDTNSENHQTKSSTSQQQIDEKQFNNRDRIRRLLSGEIRSNPRKEKNDNAIDSKRDSASLNKQLSLWITPGEEINDPQQIQEGDNTLSSSISVAQDDLVAKTEQEGMAVRRRMSEAIQFAQAVGEEISINREDCA